MLFARKDLAKILLPLLLEQLLGVTVGMFDTMMVSSAGKAAVSGVSLVVPINLLLNILFTALATGGTVANWAMRAKALHICCICLDK